MVYTENMLPKRVIEDNHLPFGKKSHEENKESFHNPTTIKHSFIVHFLTEGISEQEIYTENFKIFQSTQFDFNSFSFNQYISVQ